MGSGALQIQDPNQTKSTNTPKDPEKLNPRPEHTWRQVHELGKSRQLQPGNLKALPQCSSSQVTRSCHGEVIKTSQKRHHPIGQSDVFFAKFLTRI